MQIPPTRLHFDLDIMPNDMIDDAQGDLFFAFECERLPQYPSLEQWNEIVFNMWLASGMMYPINR